MSQHSELFEDAKNLSRWQRHKFLLLVGLTIIVSLFLVAVALSLYSTSGAAQLDLSRPGYQSVRQKVGAADEFSGFAADGTIDKSSLDTFRKIYDERTKKAATIDGFSGDVLSDKLLLSDGAPAQQQ